MNNVNRTKLLLSSLSVFRGIMKRSVVKAYYKLLLSLDSEPDEFLNAYGDFYSLISERGFSSRLAYAMTEAALFDENCFTRAAAAGKYDTLPDNVLKAVKRDCEAILAASSLTSEEVLKAYKHYGEIWEIADSLPRWETGECAPSFKMFDGSLKNVAQYYKENGCGIFARYKAFIWRDGDIQPVLHPDRIDMDSFTGYEIQRDMVVNNTKSFIEGKSCNNCLLYGDKGTGKSSTVKAIANEFRKDGLRIVEIPKERLIDFPILVDKIAALPMKFIIFIDDLSFQKQDQSYTTLKAVLEGGLAARPDNALIYATSNRRHIVKESFSDRTDDDVNTRDNMQESLSLSDRFGLAVCYSIPGKKEFVDIVCALARQKGINMSDEELEKGAERFALSRGGRSPRCAKQYVESLFC
ncbi:MAG: ATP-binding protein [Ruminococcus sp.]|jgi:predicted AAA+ superfamily ATPase|uniref:ATP-binding protein n=1 Tax=uncultured Ruminococcus sp. TaxID=165186 RepID=UPI0025E38CD6|nr:ATP-binding protein [uncultured Ruminococcus sp.]MCI2112097.1 ATP-binding protein [Ruminococcus sp.]